MEQAKKKQRHKDGPHIIPCLLVYLIRANQKQSVLLLEAAGGCGRKPPVGMPMVLILWTRLATFPALFSLLRGWNF
ncbi:hypothetical protein EYF80_004660 [Liparis tanakae]|uniref:Uncharacterized protein n=1 Tax=Liparis tanakae TaxID=230148 RepID=A0A4Z2J494_9TELE|nr:hypothetical protein EYF80_004660 [Liparis tanakae]